MASLKRAKPSDYTKENRKLRARDKSVIDPACGSGTFLLEYFKRYIQAEKEAGRDLSEVEMVKQVVENINQKLRGFDIDPFAVQLAQSNLLIHLIREKRDSEDENGVTTETDDHLDLPKFPVYETDSLLTTNDESLDPDRFYRAREPDPEHLDEIIQAKQDDYSLVMGNPPYIRYHNQTGITAEYQDLHETFGDNGPDIYVGFVEQALDWVEEGGKVAYVISDRILVNRPSQQIRQYMLDNAKIDLVVDLTRSKIFGFDVNVFPLLIVMTKTSDEEERKNNEIDVAKVFMKGSYEQRTWAKALDYVFAELKDADEPDYDFEEDFSAEKPEYEGTTNEDAYSTYTVRGCHRRVLTP